MRATEHNTTGECERCGRIKPYVLAAGFNPNGSFRMLCASCERIERWMLQRTLWKETPVIVMPEPQPEPEAEPVEVYNPQMSLWGVGELERQPAQDKARVW